MDRLLFTLKEKNNLPNHPGVYQFYDKNDTIIYVGKAKSLKKRVANYFQKKHNLDIKTHTMVEQITHIACILVNSESEALLLENNLIKSHQPRYNILLRDDKTYPYLCITDTPFPKLIATRQRTPSLGQYFGPFTDMKTLHLIQAQIRNLFQLRTCNLNLSQENIAKKKYRACLEYHIRKCQAPCEGRQTEESYLREINAVKALLKGNFQSVKKTLKEKMVTAAKNLNFEQAQQYKNNLKMLSQYQARSIITNTQWDTIDIIAIISDNKKAYLSYIHMQHGRIHFVETLSVNKKLNEMDHQIATLLLFHFRQQTKSNAKIILSNVPIDTLPQGTTLTIPKLGDKKKLVNIALQNALFFKKKNLNKKLTQEKKSNTTLIHLQQDLQLKEIPTHIECFDNSNLQGSHPVSAMVCFKNGLPAKKQYRHFHVKTVEGIDDYATMEEVIHRRYSKLIKENKPLPNLIVIDGGKGQRNVAQKVLTTLGIQDQTALISIAKRLEEIYKPNDPLPLYLSKKSPSLKLLQKIRNEAHRFAITFHRNTRTRNTFKTELEEIPKIGPKTITTLFQQFGSIAIIKAQTLLSLTQHIGPHKAQKIYDYFHHTQKK